MAGIGATTAWDSGLNPSQIEERDGISNPDFRVVVAPIPIITIQARSLATFDFTNDLD
ncbi:hypothetical protein CRG98_027151 [Punica granatum]|uniref:Uncharacterized protein n=1 Tax=Punica granatum TaxID=22663 RepID=A0A2I0J897_PUNGR|nr:hypothetical protein CRG98_027151 [Punica granatum]